MSGSVWLVTGAQASGKSTVADLLARHFERGVHVSGDALHYWPIPPYSDIVYGYQGLRPNLAFGSIVTSRLGDETARSFT